MSFFTNNSSWLIPVCATLLGSTATHFFTRWRERRASKEHRAKDLQKEIADLRFENEELKARIGQHDSRDDFIANYEYCDTGFYFRPIQGQLPEECYCSKCFDSDNKRIRIAIREDGDFACPECHNTGLFSAKMREDYFQKHLEKMSSYDQQVQNFLTYGND